MIQAAAKMTSQSRSHTAGNSPPSMPKNAPTRMPTCMAATTSKKTSKCHLPYKRLTNSARRNIVSITYHSVAEYYPFALGLANLSQTPTHKHEAENSKYDAEDEADKAQSEDIV